MSLRWLLLPGLLLPLLAQACGWWGDGESESDDSAVLIGPGAPRIDWPDVKQLTLEGNRLRKLGRTHQAFEHYRRAAHRGFAPAQNNLAVMYEFGIGVEQSTQQALSWYRKAAVQGEANAQHSLGEILYFGRLGQSDTAAGIYWLEKAAEQGHFAANEQLKSIREQGH